MNTLLYKCTSGRHIPFNKAVYIYNFNSPLLHCHVHTHTNRYIDVFTHMHTYTYEEMMKSSMPDQEVLQNNILIFGNLD